MFKPSRGTIIAHSQAKGNPRQAQTGTGARALASIETLSQHVSSVDGDGVGEIRAGAPMTLGNAAAACVRLIIVGLGSPLAGAGSIVSLVVD